MSVVRHDHESRQPKVAPGANGMEHFAQDRSLAGGPVTQPASQVRGNEENLAGRNQSA